MVFYRLIKGSGAKLKRKQRNRKLTNKERYAALLIGGLCIPLFIAAFFVYGKRSGATQRKPERPAAVRQQPEPPSPPVRSAPEPENQPERPAPEPSAPEIALAPPPASRPVRPSPAAMGNIVYVIDDAGNNLRELEPFLRFPGALTIAVLPGLPNSAEAARRARAAGKEVFLHQPMQAEGGADPGPGAIYAGMGADEVRAILQKNVDEIGSIAGINNHQGSLITQDEAIMRTVLEFCRDNGLYFLDSRTTAGTVAPKIARELGVDIAERNIFLDNDRSREAITGYLEQGLAVAREKSAATMIGHAWADQLAGVLTDSYAGLNALGYTFLTVSDAMRRRHSP
jgi:polysaccharide deacetylase 2 family uncharacterized protein YibQ